MNNSTNARKGVNENKMGSEKVAVVEVLWATPQAGLSSLLSIGAVDRLLGQQVSAKLLDEEVVITLLCRPACRAA